jgi:hypothetical protein
MGIGNLVKETLPFAPYINPPFAFPAPKEKRKCISASAQTGILFFIFYFFSTSMRMGLAFAPVDPASVRTYARVRADEVLPHMDEAKTGPRVKLRPGGKSGRTRSSGR